MLALSTLQIQYLHAEVIQIDNDTVQMSYDDLREFIKDSEELRIIKESGLYGSQRKFSYYAGLNIGTYGIGLGAGFIW